MAELPAITIASPGPESTVETSPLTVSGTASHSNGIATVELRANGGGWTAATVEFFGDWSGDVELAIDWNTIEAKAVSTTGQSKTVSTRVFHLVQSYQGENGVHWRGMTGPPGKHWTGIEW